jgi:hypothetical protein
MLPSVHWLLLCMERLRVPWLRMRVYWLLLLCVHRLLVGIYWL